jgi:type IV pilus assembly protein PilN
MNIRINLLPHRELKRAAQQRQFGFLLAGTLVLSAFVVFLGHTIIGGRIQNQESRNQFLEGEIAKLDQQIAEIKTLKEKIQALLARKEVVEALQTNRSEEVHILDEIVRRLPEGMYLNSIKQAGKTINLQGYTQSSARVSTLMRNLDASEWLENPVLVEVKAVTVNGLRANEFILTINQSAPASAQAKEGQG